MLNEMQVGSYRRLGLRAFRNCAVSVLHARRWSGFALLVWGLPSCAAEEEDPVIYAEVAPIIEAKCLRCHGDPMMHGAPVSFTTYEEASAARRMMEEHLGPSGDMPPLFRTLDPPVEDLTPEERELLLTWLRDGAIE